MVYASRAGAWRADPLEMSRFVDDDEVVGVSVTPHHDDSGYTYTEEDDSPVRAEQERAAPGGDGAAPWVSEMTRPGMPAPNSLYQAEGEKMLAAREADGHYTFDPARHVYTTESQFVVRSNPGLTAQAVHSAPVPKVGAKVSDFGGALTVLDAEYARDLFHPTEFKKLEVHYSDAEGKYNYNLDRMRVAGAYTQAQSTQAPWPVAITLVELDKDGETIARVPQALNQRNVPGGYSALDVVMPGVQQSTFRRLFDHTSRNKKALVSDVYDAPHPDDMWHGIEDAPGNNKNVPVDSILITGGDLSTEGRTVVSYGDSKYYVFPTAEVEAAIDAIKAHQDAVSIVHGQRLAFVFTRADGLSTASQRVTSKSGSSANEDAGYGACGDGGDICTFFDVNFAVQYPYTVEYIELCIRKKVDQ